MFMDTIEQVLEQFGFSISTLRCYDKQELFPGMMFPTGIRQFGDREIENFRIIECLKKSCLEIKDIK